jgi:hypothetical protein
MFMHEKVLITFKVHLSRRTSSESLHFTQGAHRVFGCQSATNAMPRSQHLTHPNVILQLLLQQHRVAKTAPL